MATLGQPWHTAEVEQVEAALHTGSDGLSAGEAARRLAEYGPNEVEAEREKPWWSLLLHQFRDPLIYILLLATAFTLVLRDFTDTAVILAVVVLNAIIGFTQERRAQRAMSALARMSAPRAEVVRDGAPHGIASRELVPGDMVRLTSGTRVPADLRLAYVRDLEIDESALTGESMPVRKAWAALTIETLVPGDQRNIAFAGTTVTRGRGRGIVVRTGASTELGQIATAVRTIGHVATPLERGVARMSRQVGIAIGVLAALVVVIGVMRAMPVAEIFLTAIAMAVSAIPEGLPVVLTITLAIGVRRMARRNAIVRALPAVETLGSTNVIASDKTGTLTQNEMTVRALWAGGDTYAVSGVGYAVDGDVRHEAGDLVDAGSERALHATLVAAVLANETDAIPETDDAPHGDPTELALLVAAAKTGVNPAAVHAHFTQLDLLPFEPERRFMASLDQDPDGARTIHMKGAPETVLARCTRQLVETGENHALEVERIRATAGELAARGLRVMAMARKDTDQRTLDDDVLASGFTFAGLAAMEDPVRREVVEAVANARTAGIRVLMLTGDHARTAAAVGAQLGLRGAGGVIDGERLETLSDPELDDALDRIDVFARVAPEHKLRIVQRLRARGDVVAVTGDGVNDAPALRAADLGVAMGASGTDVAREAADIVLADDNFSTITAAVEEGRVVFGNIRKVVFFLLSTAVGEVITILFALVAGWPLPFVAAQILWINLVTNGLQDVALAFEPGEPGLLQRPPRPPGQGILDRRLLERLAGVGVVLAIGTLGVFWWTWTTTGDIVQARTVAMTQMVVFQFFHVINCRSLDRSIFRVPLFSNPFLFVSFLLAAAAQVAALHWSVMQGILRTVPLNGTQWLVVIAVGSTVVLGGELDKWRNRRSRHLLG